MKCDLTRLNDSYAERLMPGDLGTRHLNELETTKAQYLERMAAAFVTETGIPATECEMVMQELPKPQIGWRFYYRARS